MAFTPLDFLVTLDAHITIFVDEIALHTAFLYTHLVALIFSLFSTYVSPIVSPDDANIHESTTVGDSQKLYHVLAYPSCVKRRSWSSELHFLR